MLHQTEADSEQRTEQDMEMRGRGQFKISFSVLKFT
jgi:hypothetical protein